MSVLIKGMEMPTDRSRWIVLYPDGKVDYSDKTDEWETLDKGAIPVPAHGRLIDADALANHVAEKYNAEKVGEQKAFEMADFILFDIPNAPTIILAEEGEA